MKVADLQSFIRSLASPLSASGARQVASELERACAGLESFKDLTIAQFADFLDQAERYRRDGVLAPAKCKQAKSAAVDQHKVQSFAQQILALYERATDADLQYAAIDGEVKKLDRALSKDEAIELARQVAIPGTLKSKKAALDQIARKIKERKESFERTQFRPAGRAGGSG